MQLNTNKKYATTTHQVLAQTTPGHFDVLQPNWKAQQKWKADQQMLLIVEQALPTKCRSTLSEQVDYLLQQKKISKHL